MLMRNNKEQNNIVRLTGFHEVAVGRISRVAENVILDGEELCEVSDYERVASARRAVEMKIRELDPPIHEEAQSVRRQVHGQHNEVNPVVTVQEIDSRSAAVQRLALHPQQTCTARIGHD